MFKILMIGLNFLNMFNYQIITNIEEKYEEIYYQDEYYLIYQEDNNLFLKTLNDEWIRDLNTSKNIEAFLVDKDLYIFDYSNNALKCIVYGYDGKIKNDKLVVENNILNFKIKYNDSFYIVGTILEMTDQVFINANKDTLGLKDCFIMKLNLNLEITAIRLYGGILNEEFFDLCFTESNIYLAGKKDILTSGDFGNGGMNNGDIFIIRLDFNLNIVDYVILNNNGKIIKLDFFKDNIYLTTENFLYKFDYELKNSLANKIDSKALYSVSSSFNKILVITSNKIYIYDIISLKLIHEISNDLNITKVREFKNILYIKSDNFYYFDIACLEGIKYAKQIYSKISPEYNVSTIYGNATYLEDVGEIVFDSLVYGTYTRQLRFRNIHGYDFFVKIECRVPRLSNVSEGGIYPLGYRLSFTGRAYLNDNSIANNYSIETAGHYVLKLIGLNNEEHIINFEVNSNQISFNEEKIEDYHAITKVGDIHYLNINYSNDIGIVESVVIDGEEYFDIIVNKDNKVISVKMNPVNASGIKYHIINGIRYKETLAENDLLRYIIVEEVYVINVVKNTMKINIDQINNDEYYFSIEDDLTARYFLVSYIYNNEEHISKYPISSNKIYLDNIPRGANLNVSFQIYYDLGDKSYKKIELVQLELININDNNILEIDVLKKEESLNEFALNITNKKDISRIIINNNVVYDNVQKEYYLHIAIGFVFLIIFLGGIYSLRYKNYKNKLGL